MPRRLLVTGGAGFIGANFVHYWARAYPDDLVVVLDALTYAGCRANLPAESHSRMFHFIHGDIRDQVLVEKLLRDHALNTIVHFAAESHVDRSIEGPDIFIDTNINGTHALLKAARRVWLDEQRLDDHRFHHVSTDEVYGSLGPNDPAFTEETPYAPNSPYAASKAASDHIVRAYSHTYGLKTTTSNCSNNYGPYQFPEKLIPLMILNALQGKSLPIYGDGLNIRDWLYVEDHCRGIELVLNAGRLGETYNIGGDSERTNIQIVGDLCNAIDTAFERSPTLRQRFPACPPVSGGRTEGLVTFVKDRLGHDRRYAIDARKSMQELGFRPTHAFNDGLAETLDWYVDNEHWWRAVMDGSYRQWILRQYGTV